MKLSFTFLLSVCFSLTAFSQVSIDSLIEYQSEKLDTNLFNNYTKVIQYYISRDLEQAEIYVNKQLEIAEILDIPEKKAFAKNVKGVLLSSQSEYSKALEVYMEVMETYKEMGNLERVSAVLNNISICNSNLGRPLEAVANQMESLKIKEELGVSPEKMAASYWSLGNIHWEAKNQDESTAYYRKALKIYEDLDYTTEVMQMKNTIAMNLEANPDSLRLALDIYAECAKYYKENNLNNDLASIYSSMGGVEIKADNYKEAEKYYRQALELAEAGGEKRFPGILYRRMANVNSKLGNYSDALAYAKKSLANAKELGLRKKEINDHLELASIYSKMGDYENALEYYKNYHELNDSILSNEKLIAIQDLETIYQTEKKEKEIELLTERDRINKLRQKGLLGGIIGFILLAVSLFYGLRQKLKRSKAEREKLNQEVIFTQKELDFKKQELTSFALQLANKNELLEKLKTDIREVKTDDSQKRKLQSIVNTIQISQSDEDNWESFHSRFKEVHVNFDKKMKTKYPNITTNDLRLLSLIRMNISSKEIANILNVSNDAIKKARYRLRKKMDLGSEVNLDELVMGV